jgi:hypothetical protein
MSDESDYHELIVMTNHVIVHEYVLSEQEARALLEFFMKYVGYIDEENNPEIKPLIRQLRMLLD